jgi:hypothetical protein
MPANMKMTVFCDVTPLQRCAVKWDNPLLQLRNKASLMIIMITLIMETVSTSEAGPGGRAA